jgi:hypothetical protein
VAGRPLPDYVEAEFDAYLKCGRLDEGFLRLRCEQCHAEKLLAFICKKRAFCPSCGARRMAETAALLAKESLPERPLRQWVLSLPMALRFLLATRPAGAEPERAPAHDLRRRRVSGRRHRAAGVPSGAAAGHGRPAGAGPAHRRRPASGFSLHAGLEIQPGKRAKLERLCRYASRPPVATPRLARMPSGQVRYQLKTPHRDGTTHI